MPLQKRVGRGSNRKRFRSLRIFALKDLHILFGPPIFSPLATDVQVRVNRHYQLVLQRGSCIVEKSTQTRFEEPSNRKRYCSNVIPTFKVEYVTNVCRDDGLEI